MCFVSNIWLFSGDIGLLCGNIEKLFCGNIEKLFCRNIARLFWHTTNFQHLRACLVSNIWLFSGDIGLFSIDIGLFWHTTNFQHLRMCLVSNIWLFSRDIGLFSRDIGLFWHTTNFQHLRACFVSNIWLFSGDIGLLFGNIEFFFCSNLGLSSGNLGHSYKYTALVVALKGKFSLLLYFDVFIREPEIYIALFLCVSRRAFLYCRISMRAFVFALIEIHGFFGRFHRKILVVALFLYIFLWEPEIYIALFLSISMRACSLCCISRRAFLFAVFLWELFFLLS